jgi:hypothetical protein
LALEPLIMIQFKEIETGKIKILIRPFLLLLFYTFFGDFLLSQEKKSNEFEYKAIEFFCDNINSIIPGLEISNIRFSGKTKAAPSNVFNVADCIGEINLLKDSIPNKIFLDSLDQSFNTFNYPEIKTGRKCFISTNRLFDVFNKSVYTLNLFNNIEYKGNTYVELYLINEKLRVYIIVLKLNKHSSGDINYYVKSRIH